MLFGLCAIRSMCMTFLYPNARLQFTEGVVFVAFDYQIHRFLIGLMECACNSEMTRCFVAGLCKTYIHAKVYIADNSSTLDGYNTRG